MLTKHPLKAMDIKLEGDKLSPECVQQLLKQPQGPPQLQLQPGQHLQPVPPTPQQQPQPQQMMLTQQQAQQLQASQQHMQQQQVQQIQMQQQPLQQIQMQQQLQMSQQQQQQLQPAQQQQQPQQIQQQQLQSIQLQQQPQVPQPHQMTQQQQVVTSEPQVIQQQPQQHQQQVQFIHYNGQVHAVPLGTQLPPNAQIIGTGIATTEQPPPQPQQQQQPLPTIVSSSGSFPGNVVQPYQLQQAQYPSLSQVQQPGQGQQQQQQPQANNVLPQQILSSMPQPVQQQQQQPQVSMASAIPQGGKVITVPGIPGHFVQTGPNSLIQVPPGYVFDQTNSVAVQVSQAGAGNGPVYATAPTSVAPQLQPVMSMPNGLQQPQMVTTLPNGQMIIQAGPGPVPNIISGPVSNGSGLVGPGGQIMNAQAPGGVQIRPQTPQVRIHKQFYVLFVVKKRHLLIQYINIFTTFLLFFCFCQSLLCYS